MYSSFDGLFDSPPVYAAAIYKFDDINNSQRFVMQILRRDPKPHPTSHLLDPPSSSLPLVKADQKTLAS
jgi:hypothetical protein